MSDFKTEAEMDAREDARRSAFTQGVGMSIHDQIHRENIEWRKHELMRELSDGMITHVVYLAEVKRLEAADKAVKYSGEVPR